MMNVYQSQAKTKSFNNTDMPAKGQYKLASLIVNKNNLKTKHI